MTNRFSFPNSTVVGKKDTSTHEVEVIKIEEGGNVFFCDMIRRGGLSFGGDFLVASIKDAGGEVLWRFAEANFSGLGLLAHTSGGAVIALVGNGRGGKLERILPLRPLLDHASVDLPVLLQMKQEAAKYLGRDSVLTEVEKKLLQVLAERRKAAEAEAAEAEREKRRQARQDKVDGILTRSELMVRTIDGRTRNGVPVIETEWSMLPHGTHVVLVDSFSTEKVGNPILAFVVKKVPGKNPQKENAVSVSVRNVERTPTQAVPKPLRSVLVEREGSFHEVDIYASMDDIRAARAAGLNGGKTVAVMSTDDLRTVEVFRVHKDKVDTIGKCQVIG